MTQPLSRFHRKTRRRLHSASSPRLRRLVLTAGLATGLLAAPAIHAMEPREFESPEQEQRFNALTEELRCTVCQNQSLADSDVPLAEDLRSAGEDVWKA